MAVALLFHAGAHLDHFERSTDYGPGLFLCYLVVLVVPRNPIDAGGHQRVIELGTTYT